MVTSTTALNIVGLLLDFIGVVVLFVYSLKTTGATTHADQVHLMNKNWLWLGLVLVTLGFLFQASANLFNHGLALGE